MTKHSTVQFIGAFKKKNENEVWSLSPTKNFNKTDYPYLSVWVTLLKK